ncbi:MAG TPA: trypsin-like peptidase domain-containing protein [Actinoplanes sp.]|nr:trypsin-like peptidase domain-containing protein [Actinoplanes sp.]
MNPYETDPQRHEAPSTGEPSHQPADASHEGNSPQRGESDTTAAQPIVGQPVAVPDAAPQSGVPQSGVPQSGAPQSGAAQPAPWQQHSPWQQPTAQQPGYGQQYYGQQQHYAYAGQQPPQYNAQGGWTAPDAQPAWAAPVGTEQQDPARVARGRRVLVTGAVAVLIALGAGGVGAATALAFNNNNGSSAVKTSNSSVTRVVDRSSLAQIAAAVQDSVVSITTESGEGSGVILTADGNILTNNHVVATAQGSTVQVIFADGKKATATIVGTDARTDLAVVKASGVSGLKAATLGDSSQMQVGDTVLALGSPLGLEGSVTAGIISAKDRTIQSSSDQQGQGQTNPFGQQQQQSATTTMSGLLQTDAPINPGNSGGALVNTNGEVIGINSAIATSGSNSGNIGLGFAIPSNKAKTVYEALVAGKKVSHPALGVSVTSAEGGGALVSNVTANSAAAKAGLLQGDVIKSVNGKAINSSDDLVGIIQGASVGDKVTIVFTRSGAEKTISATLTEAP